MVGGAVLRPAGRPDPEPDWADRAAVVDHRVAVERPYVGSLGFDEPRVRRLAELEVDRTADMAASMNNHFLLDDGWARDPAAAPLGPGDHLDPRAHRRRVRGR